MNESMTVWAIISKKNPKEVSLWQNRKNVSQDSDAFLRLNTKEDEKLMKT